MNSSLLSQMILIFGLIAVGYFANKTGILNEMANRCFSAFLLKIALPATILNSALNQGMVERRQIWGAALAAVGVFLLISLLSWAIASFFHWDATWQLMLNYSNLGFMGFPIIQSLYGEENMFYAAIFMMVFNLHIFTVGIWILQSSRLQEKTERQVKNREGKKLSKEWRVDLEGEISRERVKKLERKQDREQIRDLEGKPGKAQRGDLEEKLRKENEKSMRFWNPGIVSSLIAFVLLLVQIPVPGSVGEIVKSLGAVTTPLALVVIGSQLAMVDLGKCLLRRDFYVMCFLKLALYPAIVYGIFVFFAGNGIAAKIATILVGLPVAGNVTMLCSEYEGDVSLAAQGTGISILLSLLTIPLMLMLIG